MGAIGEVHHRDAALIPGLDEDIAPRDGDDRAVVGDAILLLGLGRGQFLVARDTQLAVYNVVDRVGAPVARVLTRQRGRAPPPHSSVNRTLVPSLLNVAECQ